MELPSAETQAADLDLRPTELQAARDLATKDALAPQDSVEPLLRYLTYLGAGYLEADLAIQQAPGWSDAYRRLHRLFGAASGEASVLRFHYSEAARNFASAACAARP